MVPVRSTKIGAGVLTLSGANTYTGNTLVNAGVLTLASGGSMSFVIGANGVNSFIGGTGTLNLDGAFSLNLTGAGTHWATAGLS